MVSLPGLGLNLMLSVVLEGTIKPLVIATFEIAPESRFPLFLPLLAI
jgi:hypothetical protein